MELVKLRSLLLLCVACLAAHPARAQQPPLEAKTLTRTEDTILIKGEQLGKQILGAHKERIRVYACRDGFMEPVQFQVDERNKLDQYCYTGGPKDRRRKDEDRGRIDGNDELSLLARDAGARANPVSFAMIPGYTAVQELQVVDPLDKTKAWFYVFRFDGMALPGRLKTDLVSLKVADRDDDGGVYFWRGERFAFNNRKSKTNAVRATFATIATRDQDLRGLPNMLDATQVKATVSFMWVTVKRQSDEFRVKIGGVIDGPLRMIGENIAKVYLALGIWVNLSESYVILWRNKVSMPTNVECPVNLDEGDVSNYELCMDLAKRVRDHGWQFYNSHNPKPVKIDGRTSREERELDFTYPDWNVVYGPGGGMISKFVIPKFLAQRKNSKLVYVDDEYHKSDVEGLEFEPGAIGYHGYVMDMVGLKEGFYKGDYVVWYAPPPFAPGDEQRYLNEYDHPLLVSRPGEGAPPQKK